MTIEEKTVEVLARVLAIHEEEVILHAKLRDDLGMDSLDLTEIVMELEDVHPDLGAISEQTADKWRTVEDVLKAMEKRAALARV